MSVFEYLGLHLTTLLFRVNNMASSYRFCPGLEGRRCNCILPNESRDPHSTCSFCHKNECFGFNIFGVCASWMSVNGKCFKNVIMKCH